MHEGGHTHRNMYNALLSTIKLLPLTVKCILLLIYQSTTGRIPSKYE